MTFTRSHRPQRSVETASSAASKGRAAQPGQVLVIFALAIFVLVGFVALAVDAGFLMAERRQAQAAADGAAMAAAKAYQRNESASIEAVAHGYANEYGFNESEVAPLPMESYTSPTGVGYAKCVQVTVTRDVTQFFIGAIYGGDWQVIAEGVACSTPEVRKYAMIAKDPDGKGITAAGGADVTITGGGGAMSNGDSDFCGSAAWIQADGPLDASQGIDICNNANVVSNPPNPRAEEIPDPFETYAEPSCSGYGPSETYTNKNPAATERWPASPWVPDVDLGAKDAKDYGTQQQRFKPGKYPNGISISNSFDVFFEPGLYCIGGDGLNLTTNVGGLDVVGEDVMLYFYGSKSKLNINSQHANVKFANQSNLCVAGDGGPACIVVFYSRGQISGQAQTCQDLRLNGNVVTLTGVVYTPCSPIELAGNGTLTVNGQIVGGEIDVKGGNQVVVNYQNGLSSDPSQVYLVD